MRVLFCSLGSHGFLNPTIGLALRAQRSGHDVALVTDITSAAYVERQGIRRLPRGPGADGRSFEVQSWAYPYAVAIQVRHIEHALEVWPADVIVGQQLTLGALIVAERAKLPVALIGFATYLWPTGLPPRSCGYSDGRDALVAWRHTDMMRHYNAARQLHRLRAVPDSPAHSHLLGDLFMVRSIPALEEASASLPDRVKLVGSCLWEPEGEVDDEIDAWLTSAKRANRSVLYVEHGRTFRQAPFWPVLREAVGSLQVGVIASVGRMDADEGAVPAHWLVRAHVPQGRVLQVADAVVASATSTVVLGAIRAGLPALLIPAGGEQPDLAEVCEHAGCASVLLPDHVTPESLADGVRRTIASDALRQRAQVLGKLFAGFDDFGRAVALVEDLVARHRVRDRVEAQALTS